MPDVRGTARRPYRFGQCATLLELEPGTPSQLNAFSAAARLLHSSFYRGFRFAGFSRLVPGFIILPACHASPVLFAPSAQSHRRAQQSTTGEPEKTVPFI